jgi:3-hydroxypropanoate dehydrogenase
MTYAIRGGDPLVYAPVLQANVILWLNCQMICTASPGAGARCTIAEISQDHGMHPKLDAPALDILFRSARTRNGWSTEPVSEEQICELYELLKWGPTSGNGSPARFIWVRSEAGKAKLAALASEANAPKILAAPLTVIIGYDLDFGQQMPKLFPARGEAMKAMFTNSPVIAETTAFRNSSLQGAYLILAARALGLDCGPMSGFDNAAVDREFFGNSRVRSNFICGLGHGTEEKLFPRNPRLSFEEAGRFA